MFVQLIFWVGMGKTIFHMELNLKIKSGKIHVDSKGICTSVRILVIFILGFWYGLKIRLVG